MKNNLINSDYYNSLAKEDRCYIRVGHSIQMYTEMLNDAGIPFSANISRKLVTVSKENKQIAQEIYRSESMRKAILEEIYDSVKEHNKAAEEERQILCGKSTTNTGAILTRKQLLKNKKFVSFCIMEYGDELSDLKEMDIFDLFQYLKSWYYAPETVSNLRDSEKEKIRQIIIQKALRD